MDTGQSAKLGPENLGEVSGVLENRSFLYLWVAQAVSQTALNAIVYSLLVNVEAGTSSSTALGLIILSFIIPSVVIGVAAGVFVDRWRKKTVLLTTNLLRAGIVAAFIPFWQDFWLVLMVNLVFSIVSQFFAPAEVAAIPAIVRKHQLIVANGLFNLTMSGAQLMGFVILGPILVKSMPPPVFYLVLALLYVLCAVLVSLMRMQEPELKRDGVDLRGGLFREVIEEIREGWRLLVRDDSISLSLVHLTLMNSLVLIVGMLAPGYVSRVLGIRADDSVYIMAPAGVGMLAGISLLPRLTARWAKQLLANTGIVTTAAVLLALGLLGAVKHLLPPMSLGNLPAVAGLVLIVMGLALVMGFAYALVNVSAQTLVQERVPVDLRGRIFATQFAFANAAAVLPLLFIGGLADLIGINQVTLLFSMVVLAAGVFSITRSRPMETVPGTE